MNLNDYNLEENLIESYGKQYLDKNIINEILIEGEENELFKNKHKKDNSNRHL